MNIRGFFWLFPFSHAYSYDVYSLTRKLFSTLNNYTPTHVLMQIPAFAWYRFVNQLALNFLVVQDRFKRHIEHFLDTHPILSFFCRNVRTIKTCTYFIIFTKTNANKSRHNAKKRKFIFLLIRFKIFFHFKSQLCVTLTSLKTYT